MILLICGWLGTLHSYGFSKLIYKHDEKVMKLSEEERFNYRLEHMEPIYQRFKDWGDAVALIVTPKSPMGKAMTYLQNQWPNLRTLFQHAKILIDNNLIDNKIGPLALGRKNYLFAGSHEGAQRAAMMYSFFATCKAQGVNPQEWLTKKLEKTSDTKLSKLHTPCYQATSQSKKNRPALARTLTVVIVSPFGQEVTRITRETAIKKNETIIKLSDQITAGYLSPNGKLDRLLHDREIDHV